MVGNGPAHDNHLAAHIGCGLEQNGVHVHKRKDSGSLGLHNLSPAHFQSFNRYPGVVGHILGFERGRPKAFIQKKSAQGRCQNAFAHIGTGSEYRQTPGFIILGIQ
jgi:hypothetical protein